MALTTRTQLEQLDLALTRLRRLWESPVVRRRLLEMVGGDVDPTLIRTLRAVERTELAEPGITDVALILGVDDSTASRLVDAAVTAGTVTRTTSTRDRRRSVLQLTEAGTSLLRSAMRARTTLLREVTRDWDADDIAALVELLERFTTAATKVERTS